MFKIITNNWPAKIICLLLAVGLWIFVTLNSAKIANFPGNITLETKNIPVGMTAISDTQNVQIKISADRSLWNRLSASNFNAYVDLANLSTGTHELDIKVACNLSGVQIVSTNPEKVLVTLEPLVKKTVSVIAQVEGTAGEGLTAGDIKIEPSEVELSGAQSIVGQIYEATAIIKLNGETTDSTKAINVVALDAEGEIIKNISFNPSAVKVTVPIIKGANTKTVGIKAKITGQPKVGFWVKEIRVNPADVAITGSASVLKSTNYIETKDINIDNIDANKSLTADLNLTSGLSSIDKISQVKVDIILDKTLTQKEVIASYNWQNLASNLKIDSISPASVKVIFSGYADQLANLTGDNVKLNIGLSDYKSAGSYDIDLSKDLFIFPESLSVVSYLPTSISITLVNK
ncbi:MAG: CdaR family protein [Patescibacteria group bacterium]|nr:CdaR family protein [Patescibacteria group bacterium]